MTSNPTPGRRTTLTLAGLIAIASTWCSPPQALTRATPRAVTATPP
jgi:hypothetical protein